MEISKVRYDCLIKRLAEARDLNIHFETKRKEFKGLLGKPVK